jgi:hypothetical protein
MRSFSFVSIAEFRKAILAEKGSALVLVLVILTALTILCTLILKGATLHTKAIILSERSLQAFYLAEGAIYKTLWMLSGHEGKGPDWRPVEETLSVFDDHTALVTVSDWGGFLRVTAEVTLGTQCERLRVLVGVAPPHDYDRAIITGGVGYPLVVTGNNRIVGDVLVGMKGVETGTIQGQGFVGSEPVQGRVERAQSPKIPPVDPSQFIRSIQTFQRRLSVPSAEEMLYQDVILDSTFIRAHPVRSLHVGGNVIIQAGGSDPLLPDDFSLSCSGNLTLQGFGNLGNRLQFVCNGQLQVLDAPDLHTGLFYAEKGILLSHSGKVDGQFLSPGDIRVEGQTRLSYPSLLFCGGRLTDEAFRGQIVLAENAHVEGTVCLYPAVTIPERIPDESQIVIGSAAEVRGAIYSSRQTVFEGTLHGCIATEEFSLYVAPTTYVNWLKDATIDRTRLPADYVMPVGFNAQSQFRILEWEEMN